VLDDGPAREFNAQRAGHLDEVGPRHLRVPLLHRLQQTQRLEQAGVVAVAVLGLK
jgi:hypothetical protein